MYKVEIIKSPNGLIKNEYQYKDILHITNSKFTVFVDAGISDDEQEEAKIQELTNYDCFYTAPIVDDYNDELYQDKKDIKNKFLIILGSVAVIVICIIILIWQIINI